MAAKSKAPVKGKKATVAKKATAARAKPKGLQLTAAQQAAYNKAYAATATSLRHKLALRTAAQAFRKGRLGAAHATLRQYSRARGSAQAAAIAANASHMSFVQSRLAHQNSALQARIEQNMANHASLSGRLQYAQAGEKVFAHVAVMRTVDMAQATNHQAALFAKVAKIARKAGKSTLKSGPNSAGIARKARAAGLAAASRVKTTPVKAKTTARRGRPKGSVKGTPGTKAVKAGAKSAAKSASASKKAPVKRAKARTAPGPGAAYAAYWAGQVRTAKPRVPAGTFWLGDEVTPNCIATAVANHLLHTTGITVTDEQVAELTLMCEPESCIEEVLWKAWLTGWPWNGRVRLGDFVPFEGTAGQGGLVIGFATPQGDHAALSLDEYQVVSWGSVTDLESPVEEAWELRWLT